MQQLTTVELPDLSMLWIFFPQLESSRRANAMLAVQRLLEDWLVPMKAYCATRGPGSPVQRTQVRDLLWRCGWTDHSDALALVLDTLQWDTVEVLHFALERLRRRHDQLWLPMAKRCRQNLAFKPFCRCGSCLILSSRFLSSSLRQNSKLKPNKRR